MGRNYEPDFSFFLEGKDAGYIGTWIFLGVSMAIQTMPVIAVQLEKEG